MQLDRTVIFPTDNLLLARLLYQSLVHEEAVLVLFVLGEDELALKTVSLADKLARIEILEFNRKVAWCRDRNIFTEEFSKLTAGKADLTGEDLDQVVAFSLSLSDAVMDIVRRDEIIDFVRIDDAFFRAGMRE